MIKAIQVTIGIFALTLALPAQTIAAEVCTGYSPQTPRDISNKAGTNGRTFTRAVSADKLNICNIHMHNAAEHKGPGFSVFAGKGDHGGYKCNATAKLTKAELQAPAKNACKGVKPGDTIEVHWVYSSCDVKPGKGLGACLSDKCANPQLRVEAQTFLVVNSRKANDFGSFDYQGSALNGLHQAKALPSKTGKPVIFLGSTTGPSYSESKCAPLQVTWSVRPMCAKVDINSLSKWCEGNAFQEDHAHGVRQLVTDPRLLAPIR